MRIWKGVLFVIVNDRSRYCFVARECLLENKKKKKEKERKKKKCLFEARVVDWNR